MVDVYEVRDLMEKDLLSYDDVVGVGIGESERRVRVYVKEWRSEVLRKIPKKLAGYYVEVIEAGVFRPLSMLKMDIMDVVDRSRTMRWRPAPCGVSIGHFKITAGTLGAVVYRDGRPFILSNNHVLANCDCEWETRASVGDHVYQPGPIDGGSELDAIARLSSWVKLGRTGNLVDCALAEPISPDLVEASLLGVGGYGGVASPRPGMAVVKSGRTTAVTCGTIIDVDATIKVEYPIGTLEFRGQIITTRMASGGDSGSLLVDAASGKVVGLLFAGSDRLTAHNNITYVIEALGFKLPPKPAVPPRITVDYGKISLGISATAILVGGVLLSGVRR